MRLPPNGRGFGSAPSFSGDSPQRHLYQGAEKDPAHRLLKNAQIQGTRNPKE